MIFSETSWARAASIQIIESKYNISCSLTLQSFRIRDDHFHNHELDTPLIDRLQRSRVTDRLQPDPRQAEYPFYRIFHCRGRDQGVCLGPSVPSSCIPQERLEHHRLLSSNIRVRLLIIISIFSVIEICAGTLSLKSLRIVRIFRPLKSLNAISSKWEVH